MKQQIDLHTLTIEQARGLLLHLDARLDASTAINNMLIEKLTMIARMLSARDADGIADILKEWTFTIGSMEDASKAEVQRILGFDQTPLASTIN